MKVSIIITSYNYGKYIERCIRSCMDQNFPKDRYEIIVVDDKSTDETAQILENYKDISNFRYVINKENLGVAGASNEGIKMARGQYVVRLDADDYVSANYIFFLSEYLNANHDAFCVACDYVYVDDNEEKIERVYAEEKPVSCGIMYRKDVLIEAGMYNPEWRHREEEELRKRMGSYYKLHYLKIPLYRYRMHKSNKTLQLDMMEEFKDRLETVQAKDHQVINVEKEKEAVALDDRVIVVIPARGGSERLKKKNIYPIWGKPMICWAIEAAKKSKYVSEIFVTTDDPEIKQVSLDAGANVIDRPHKLAEGKVYKQDAICHAVSQISAEGDSPTLVISLQANSPQVKTEQIDSCIDHLIKYGKQEVMSVDKNLNQDAAIRVMTQNAVFQKTLSTNFGVVVTDLHDVHDLDDVKQLESKKV